MFWLPDVPTWFSTGLLAIASLTSFCSMDTNQESQILLWYAVGEVGWLDVHSKETLCMQTASNICKIVIAEADLIWLILIEVNALARLTNWKEDSKTLSRFVTSRV